MSPRRFRFAQLPRLFPYFKWADNTWICNYIKSTTWVFPLVETIHILSLVVLLGSVLLIDFRLRGIGLKAWTPKDMAVQLRCCMKYGLITSWRPDFCSSSPSPANCTTMQPSAPR